MAGVGLHLGAGLTMAPLFLRHGPGEQTRARLIKLAGLVLVHGAAAAALATTGERGCDRMK